MAPAAYKLNLKVFMDAGIALLTDTVKARLVRVSAYTFSQAHQFASSLPAAIVTDVTLGTKLTTDGVFDAADAVFTAVPAGAAIDAVVIFKDTGVAGTSNLLVYLDGFSIVPNTGDITLQWAAASPNIFAFTP